MANSGGDNIHEDGTIKERVKGAGSRKKQSDGEKV